MGFSTTAAALFLAVQSPKNIPVSSYVTRRVTRIFADYSGGKESNDIDEPPSRETVIDENSVGAAHHCVSCGACCSYFRVSFPYFEVEQRGIPEDMAVEVAFPYVAMKGTHQVKTIRCTALQGEVGKFGTLCGIYERRPSSCRDFSPTLEDGKTRNEYCDKARKALGLAPLQFEDWMAYLAET